LDELDVFGVLGVEDDLLGVVSDLPAELRFELRLLEQKGYKRFRKGT